jgi:hypothetical protein
VQIAGLDHRDGGRTDLRNSAIDREFVIRLLPSTSKWMTRKFDGVRKI